MNLFRSVIDLELSATEFPAVDVDMYGNYIAFDGKNTVNINGTPMPLQTDTRIYFPWVQMLDNGSFLLADMRADRENVFIFASDGSLQSAFYAGDAIQDMAFSAGKIVVSYFDEGVFGEPPSTEGLAVFDTEGKLLFGVNTSVGDTYICDCYALCKQGEHSVAFFAYRDFELAELNLTTFQLKRTPLPEILNGASAMVFDTDSVIFVAPYHQNNSLFRYHLYTKNVEKLGESEFAIFKGIENGHFLAIKDGQYYLVGL